MKKIVIRLISLSSVSGAREEIMKFIMTLILTLSTVTSFAQSLSSSRFTWTLKGPLNEITYAMLGVDSLDISECQYACYGKEVCECSISGRSFKVGPVESIFLQIKNSSNSNYNIKLKVATPEGKEKVFNLPITTDWNYHHTNFSKKIDISEIYPE